MMTRPYGFGRDKTSQTYGFSYAEGYAPFSTLRMAWRTITMTRYLTNNYGYVPEEEVHVEITVPQEYL